MNNACWMLLAICEKQNKVYPFGTTVCIFKCNMLEITVNCLITVRWIQTKAQWDVGSGKIFVYSPRNCTVALPTASVLTRVIHTDGAEGLSISGAFCSSNILHQSSEEKNAPKPPGEPERTRNNDEILKRKKLNIRMLKIRDVKPNVTNHGNRSLSLTSTCLMWSDRVTFNTSKHFR